MAVILDIGTERFSTSVSLCHPDASHTVSSQSVLLFGRRLGLKNFKMVAILDIGTDFLGFWNRTNFHNTPMPPIMFKLNQTNCSAADVI